MVYCGILFHSRTPLVIIDGNLKAQRYVAELLELVVIPFLGTHAPRDPILSARQCLSSLSTLHQKFPE